MNPYYNANPPSAQIPNQDNAPPPDLNGMHPLDYNRMLFGLTAGAGALGNFAGIANRRLNLPQFEPQNTNGQPSYYGGQINAATSAHPQGAQAGDILGGGLQGAAVGTSILPGLGTAIGGGIGLIGSAISGAIGKNQQDTEKNRALESAHNYQTQYNQSANNYQQQQDSNTDYARRISSSNRFRNLYQPPGQYA